MNTYMVEAYSEDDEISEFYVIEVESNEEAKDKVREVTTKSKVLAIEIDVTEPCLIFENRRKL